MLDWSSCPAVERDPDRVSGAWVFRGTRVPVKALFENLESAPGSTISFAWLPGVSIEMAEAVLEPLTEAIKTKATITDGVSLMFRTVALFRGETLERYQRHFPTPGCGTRDESKTSEIERDPTMAQKPVHLVRA